MKKFIVLVLSASLIISAFTGCGNNAANSNDPAPDPEPVANGEAPEVPGVEDETPTLSGELTFSVFAGEPFNSSWSAMFEQFESETGVRVHLDAIPWENLMEMQTLELASGSGTYDVLYVHPSWYQQFAANGYLVPVEDFASEEDLAKFVPSLLGLFDHNDRIYALPDWITTIMLVYRTDLFEEKGLSAPQSWDDVLSIAEIFAEEDDMYGIVFPGGNVGSLAGTFLTTLLSNDSWIVDDDGNPNMDSPEALETLEYFNRLGAFAPTGFLNFHWEETSSILTSGMAPMGKLLTVTMRDLDDPEQSQITGVWGYAPITQRTAGGAIDCWGWAVASSSNNIEAAAALVKFMTDTDVQLQLTALNGTVGATQGYYDSPEPIELLPFLPIMNEAFAGRATKMPSWETWFSEQDELEINMQRMFSGDMTPEEVAEAVQARMIDNRS